MVQNSFLTLEYRLGWLQRSLHIKSILLLNYKEDQEPSFKTVLGRVTWWCSSDSTREGKDQRVWLIRCFTDRREMERHRRNIPAKESQTSLGGHCRFLTYPLGVVFTFYLCHQSMVKTNSQRFYVHGNVGWCHLIDCHYVFNSKDMFCCQKYLDQIYLFPCLVLDLYPWEANSKEVWNTN